jgi:hypothetical protein
MAFQFCPPRLQIHGRKGREGKVGNLILKMKKKALKREFLRRFDAHWRTAKHPSFGPIPLFAHPLIKKPSDTRSSLDERTRSIDPAWDGKFSPSSDGESTS